MGSVDVPTEGLGALRERELHDATGLGPGAAAYEQFPDLGTPDELPTTVLDTSGLLPQREAAIAAHRSQISPFEGLPDDLRRAFLGRDHLIRVVPAWTGCRAEASSFVEQSR